MLAVIPYRPEVHLNYYPVISILIILGCIILHYQVEENIKDISLSAAQTCEKIKSRKFKIAIKSVYGGYSNEACANFLIQAYVYPDKDIIIEEFVTSSKKLSIYSKENSKKFVRKYLNKGYERFLKNDPPEYLQGQYAYVGGSWDITKMISSSFAHASWDHLIGNILGYLAFGLLVELIIGPIYFVMLLTAISLGVGVASSIWYGDSEIPKLFLGLSGVVFGMMGALAYLWPNAKIRTIFWIIIFFKRVSLPAWILAGCYIAWNVHYLSSQTESNVNYVAHVIGAVIAFIFSLILLRDKKQDLKYMLQN